MTDIFLITLLLNKKGSITLPFLYYSGIETIEIRSVSMIQKFALCIYSALPSIIICVVFGRFFGMSHETFSPIYMQIGFPSWDCTITSLEPVFLLLSVFWLHQSCIFNQSSTLISEGSEILAFDVSSSVTFFIVTLLSKLMSHFSNRVSAKITELPQLSIPCPSILIDITDDIS